MKPTGLQLDWETADRITVLNLTDTRDSCIDDLYRWKCDLIWMHADDVTLNIRRVDVLNELLEYFGETIGPEHKFNPSVIPEHYLQLKEKMKPLVDPLNPDTYPEKING